MGEKKFPTENDLLLFKQLVEFFKLDIKYFENKEFFCKKILEDHNIGFSDDNLMLLEGGFLDDVFDDETYAKIFKTLEFMKNKDDVLKAVQKISDTLEEDSQWGEPTYLLGAEEEEGKLDDVIVIELDGNILASKKYIEELIENGNENMLTMPDGEKMNPKKAIDFINKVIADIEGGGNFIDIEA